MDVMQNVYKPISFWSWNGDMRDEEIRLQIHELKEKGFGGFFIHSRAGLLIPYMSDAWFRAAKTAIEEAKNLNMDAWLYDEDGWPSGFAGGMVNGCGEEYCGKTLRFFEGKPNLKDVRIIAVYRKNAQEDYYRISQEQAREDDLYCCYEIVRHYVDIMDRKVIAKFIEVTHEEYKKRFGSYFGTVVKGIFTDEPQMPDGPCWSLCMSEKYQEKYKEDILDKMWLMHIKGEGYQKFRYRFWACANELMHQNFVCQINDWCKENHLIFTGHFSSEDGLIEQTKTSGGVMPLYQDMGMPGIDHLGNRYATAVLLKQVTSVAHRRNLDYVLSESFGCAGWDVSFKELLGIAGWQAVFGVNTLCTHVSAYSILGRRKRDYPVFFSYQTPWWKDAGVLFGAIEKLNRELGKGKRMTKVAVLHPIRSVWCENSHENCMDSKFMTAQFRELVDHLLDIQVDFDLLDESEMSNAVAEGNGIRAGAVEYKRLIVPESITLSKDTVKLLETFTVNGGELIFINGRPTSIEGDKDDPLVEVVRNLKAAEIQNTRNILQKYFRAYPVQDVYNLYDVRLENEVSGLVSRYGVTQEGAILYLFNPRRGHKIQTVLRHSGICSVSTVSLTEDKETEVTDFYENGSTYAKVSVESGCGVLLRITRLTHEKTIKKPCFLGSSRVPIEQIHPLEKNAITLDMGRFKINEGSYSEKKAVIHMLDEIYTGIAESQTDAKVEIEYTFEAQFGDIPEDISLAAEKIEALEIRVNGYPIVEEDGWWMDRGIKDYRIAPFVQNGMNCINLTYTIPNTGKVNNLSGKFESERNRFFYEIEPESIYIRGSFDVSREREVFTLTDPTVKTVGNLTTQNMWFYSGDCAYTGYFDYDGVQEISVVAEQMRAVSAKVYVNNRYAGMIIAEEDRVSITGYLKKGRNEITVVANGHRRNLLGPHHHIRGANLYFVGPSTFVGTVGFEDFISPEIGKETSGTWTDNYSFVPFGIDGIIIERGKEA